MTAGALDRSLTIFARYGTLGASSRLRFAQYFGYLRSFFSDLRVHSLFDDSYLSHLYGQGRRQPSRVGRCYVKRASDALRAQGPVWIEKELFPCVPAWIERGLLMRADPVCLDYDDAIFHMYDSHSSRFVRRALGRKIDRLMSIAALVTAGNDYLAERATAAGASRVEVLPTVVDIERYSVRDFAETSRDRIIGWIGSPGSQRYLRSIEGPLTAILKSGGVRCHLVGATPDAAFCSGVDVKTWSEATEALDIRKFDVGLMPLPDEPWARGKCAYKIIQYMASGVPVVASPVGMNLEVVKDGVNGFLASSASDWTDAISLLLREPELRARMGRAGRNLVEQTYSVQVTGPRLVGLFRDVIN